MAERPLVDDAQAVPMLGNAPMTFASFDNTETGWVPSQAAIVQIDPEGNHYRYWHPDTPESHETALPIHFVPLDDGHWLTQITFDEPSREYQAFFGVATWDGSDLLLTLIACDNLHDRAGINLLVRFQDDDCILSPPPPGLAPEFPELLWQDMPSPLFKLVLQP